MQDQRLAMSWVRDHISSFGGDSKNVMIFGESAGGNSVINHLAQPASFPLYTKAIIESGAYDSGATPLSDDKYTKLLSSVGCTTLACLKNTSAKAISQTKPILILLLKPE